MSSANSSTQYGSSAHLDEKAGTRRTILEILKRSGESDVNGLTKELGISGVAVRQHLTILEEAGQVTFRLVRKPVGRPARVYTLTEAAEKVFPQNTDKVAMDLLARMEQLMGRAALDRLFETRLKDLNKQYRKKLRGARSLKKKLELLAEIRDAEGYLCNVEPAEGGPRAKGGVRLVEHHCPIADLARQYPQVCSLELKLFKQVLGEPEMERVEHIRSGGHACAYVAPKAKGKQ